MSAYATYTRFHGPEEALAFTEILMEKGIPYTIEHEINQLDKIYAGEALEAMFAVKVPGSRFAEVDALQAAQATLDMALPETNHYFNAFSTAELQDVLLNPTDWNAYDTQVARILLSRRREEPVIPPVLPEEYIPTPLKRKWIVLGYIAALLGVWGILAGLAITQAKRTLSSGDTVHMFHADDRRRGRRMVIIGIASIVLRFIIELSARVDILDVVYHTFQGY